MCTRIVTPRYVDVKTGQADAAENPDTALEEPLPGYPSAGAERSAARQERRRTALLRATRYIPGDPLFRPGVPHILDRPLLNLPGLDRRRAARCKGIVLEPAERDHVRQAIGAALGCGSRFASFRRTEMTDAGLRELRLACQLKCGNRTCPDCDEERRKRESWRVEGPWKMFVTFTLPLAAGSTSKCWRLIGKWLGRLTKKLGKTARSNDTWPILHGEDRGWAVQLQAGDENADAMVYKGLDYAWAIEPHKSGRPHVHMVLSAEYVDYEWLIVEWRKATRTSEARIYGVRIKSPDGVTRYLCKYISKATLTSDILGILRRKRLWACTLPSIAPKEPLWSREVDVDADQAWREIQQGRTDENPSSWTCEARSDGRYAIWSRPITGLVFQEISKQEEEKNHFVLARNIEGRMALVPEPESLGWLDDREKPPWHKYCR